MRTRATLALCALAGALHAVSFAPWNLPALQLAALAALAALSVRQASARASALAGFAFGLGWFGVGVSWIDISLHVYGELPALLAALATALFAALLAAFPALACAAAHRLAPAAPARLLLAWPGAWVACEWLRGTVLTGFPWIASGYAHTDSPLAGFAPLTGVYGVSLAAAWIAGALALLSLRGGGARKAAVAGGIVLILGGGQMCRAIAWTHPTGAPLRVELVQGNVAQDLKFADGGLELSVKRYFSLLEQAAGERADLVVLPESAFPVPLGDLPPDVREALPEFARAQHTALIFGAFIEEPVGHYFNSAIGLQDDEAPQRYSKRHLVPFGEFIPFGFRWFVDWMHIPIGDQEHGAARQAPMQLAGQRIAVNICYEDLFGREIIAAWSDPALEPTILLNVSNLAWFDDSIALPQHLQISRMRAIETGRPLLRATNTGVTAAIDARGRVLAQLPVLTAQALHTSVTGHTGRTPYVRWGDAPALALVAALLAGAGLAARRRRPPPGAVSL